MKPFEKCPSCGGDLETRQVNKVLSGGGNTALLRVPAEICLRCGEHLYHVDVVLGFEEIRDKLKQQEFTHFKAIGQSFTVEDGWPNNTIQPMQ